jgi:hypothetical protein
MLSCKCEAAVEYAVLCVVVGGSHAAVAAGCPATLLAFQRVLLSQLLW